MAFYFEATEHYKFFSMTRNILNTILNTFVILIPCLKGSQRKERVLIIVMSQKQRSENTEFTKYSDDTHIS